VTDQGDWHVTYPKPKEMEKVVDKKMKVAAGGPGSGRHPGFGAGLAALKAQYPKVHQHLLDRSREAELNTGDPAGESGTFHHISSLPPSKQMSETEHALVHHTATSMGPDMAYNKTARLAAKVRASLPNGKILDSFEKGTLAKHVAPHVLGPKSDKYRESGDKYY